MLYHYIKGLSLSKVRGLSGSTGFNFGRQRIKIKIALKWLFTYIVNLIYLRTSTSIS